jgi:hypothetical protein
MFFLLLILCSALHASENSVVDLLTSQPSKPAWQKQIESFQNDLTKKLGLLELAVNKKLVGFGERIDKLDTAFDQLISAQKISDDMNGNLYRMASMGNSEKIGELERKIQEQATAIASLISYTNRTGNLEVLFDELEGKFEKLPEIYVGFRELNDRLQNVVLAERFNIHTHECDGADLVSLTMIKQKTSGPNN